MTNVVTFCRALSDGTRWRIVRMALEEALCVCELADVLEMPQSSVSSHVQVLRRAGLLESEKCEKWTYFRILPEYRPLVAKLAAALPTGEEAWSGDGEKLRKRLAARAESCCPGPVLLGKRRSTTTTGKTTLK